MKDAEVHHVPAKISLDGPAPVSTYFLPAAAETDDKPAAGKSATTGTAEDSDSSDDEAHDCGEVVVGSTTTGRGTLRCKWTQRSLRYRFGGTTASPQAGSCTSVWQGLQG
ncbi:hypothetical protein FNF29_05637 [Cafeteria roenbergensis]|uniref:Uncharacterized protein n=1 Tax=Cafeteria roenbergensis TaxID=33653 RepID=A0A5A8CDD5_CAFRO|nr:hypothetical protein FNF29_05637 [Cafeteria roenbergensis]|eukprot:KAA0149811.1 hypothetical protein FNF29_05637 [Cafeteria roenbergensis]